MLKYRIIVSASKFVVQVKRKTFFGELPWHKVDYFYSESEARDFINSLTGTGVIYETDWK